jgi:hypothetical protein
MARSATFSPQPDAAALLAKAEAETGLHDFGAGGFRGPLDAFVRFLNSAELGADDRRAAFGQMVGVLGWRLRLVEDRKRYPAVCHVSYPDLTADPVAVVHAVYKHFGLPLDEVAPAVQAWLDDPGNRADRYGKWTYDLAGHGVSADEVRERFGSYRERYGL